MKRENLSLQKLIVAQLASSRRGAPFKHNSRFVPKHAGIYACPHGRLAVQTPTLRHVCAHIVCYVSYHVII